MSTEISKESKLELEHNDLENKLKKLSDPKIQDIVRDSKESIKEENILENDYNNISNQITHLKDYILNLNFFKYYTIFDLLVFASIMHFKEI